MSDLDLVPDPNPWIFKNSRYVTLGRYVFDLKTGHHWVPTPWNERTDIPQGMREALTLIATR